MAIRLKKTVILVCCVALLFCWVLWSTSTIYVPPFPTTSSDPPSLAAADHVVYSTTSEETVLDPFRPVLSPADEATLRRTVAAIVLAFDSAGVTYWLDGGALIGSYRHHDLVPWDGDVDLVVLAADELAVRRTLYSLAPRYSYCEEFYGRRSNNRSMFVWRVSSTVGSRRHHRADGVCHGMRFPYVDIITADENSTHVWLELPATGYRLYVYRRHGVVFPLRRRPLGAGFQVQTPCDVDTYLSLQYSGYLDVCSTSPVVHHDWSHIAVSQLPCRLLADRYAFVDRRRITQLDIGSRTPDGENDGRRSFDGDEATLMIETLRCGNQTQSQFIWSPEDCRNSRDTKQPTDKG